MMMVEVTKATKSAVAWVSSRPVSPNWPDRKKTSGMYAPWRQMARMVARKDLPRDWNSILEKDSTPLRARVKH